MIRSLGWMKLQSITIKILPLIIISFVLTIVGVLFISKVQLTEIIDKSQHEIFAEKVDLVWESLKSDDVRLQKTGLVEAYEDDIKKSTIDKLKNRYYRQADITLKPIILDENSKVIMHPVFPPGYTLMAGGKKITSHLVALAGQFYATTDDRNMWYVYRVFEPWEWVIVYAVPLDEKYEDVSKFSSLLLFTMFSITLFVAILLSLAIARLMRPIGELTDKALEISRGKLDNPINIHSSDEIGLLADSFDKMRKAIQSQISNLNTEVAERRKMELSLRESEERFRVLHNASFGGIVIHDKGKVLDCNQGLSEITGYLFDELIGMDGLKLIAPDWRETVLQNILSAVEHPYEVEGERKNGEIYPLYIQGKNIPYKGRTVRVVEFRDITQQRFAEEEKIRLESQLHQAQKMESVGQLAGGVAHDFNNMLSAILGHAEIAMMRSSPSDMVASHLKGIEEAALRSADLVKQLLAFARKQTIAPRVLDINDMSATILKMLHRIIGEDIDLSWQPGSDLWKIHVDPSQLDQLLVNLCVNARDAITGGGKIIIETRNSIFDQQYCQLHTGFVPGEYVMLSVSDDGCGMSKDIQEQIFEPFFTTKELGQGTGLGLATVYGIVKQNNGFINIYSEPEKGTTFRVYLPRYIGEEIGIPSEILRDVPRGNREQVLLVEDESVMREVAVTLLEELNYKVYSASTPGEAIELIKKHHDDVMLLITDVVMPEMNGRELAQIINGINPDIRCLFTSGYTANVIAHHGVLDEDVWFLPKPFSMNDLAIKVHEALGQK